MNTYVLVQTGIFVVYPILVLLQSTKGNAGSSLVDDLAYYIAPQPGNGQIRCWIAAAPAAGVLVPDSFPNDSHRSRFL